LRTDELATTGSGGSSNRKFEFVSRSDFVSQRGGQFSHYAQAVHVSGHGERTASELQDRVTELIEQQTAISEVLRAIASSPHDFQPIFDAILDSATRLCRADIGSLGLSEEGGLRRVALGGTPFWLVSCGHHS
jgi:hypothetical protein